MRYLEFVILHFDLRNAFIHLHENTYGLTAKQTYDFRPMVW